jgi:hypothetical protein
MTLPGVVVVHRPIRNPLPYTLMRSGLVEIAHILPGDIFEVLVVEEEHVLEGFASQTADEPFANGIHVRGPHRRPDHPRTRASAKRSNVAPNFSSRSRIKNLGVKPSMVAFRNCWS